MAYRDFKYLTRRTASNKTFPDEAFNIAKNWKYDGYQRGIASGDAARLARTETLATRNKSAVKNENMSKKYVKPIIKKSRKEKYSHLL